MSGYFSINQIYPTLSNTISVDSLLIKSFGDEADYFTSFIPTLEFRRGGHVFLTAVFHETKI